MTFQETLIMWILISMGVFMFMGIINKMFFKVAKPTPKKVVVERK